MTTNTSRKNIRHSDIFDYWKDKVIFENGKVGSIKDIGENSARVSVVFDWGEPCCWACDKPIIGKYEKNRGKEVDFERLWNDDTLKKKLERCHIIPRAKGGEDTPSNMFLLCSECHEVSPDTVNDENFFRWVYDQRKSHCSGMILLKEMIEKFERLLKRRYPNASLEEICNIVYKENDVEHKRQLNEEMFEYLKTHTNSHWSSYSETTLLCGTLDWLLHKYVDELLKT